MEIMNRENEKRVVEEICDISGTCDYSDNNDIDAVLTKIKDRDYFKDSVFGKRYIQRLSMLLTGVTASDCVLCGKEAINNVVCNTCIQKISQLNKKDKPVEAVRTESKVPAESVQASRRNVTVINQVVEGTNEDINEDITIEELFKDMDDSLLQLASQVTAKSIKRLSWVNIALGIVNFIMTFFLALFLWKFITSQ